MAVSRTKNKKCLAFLGIAVFIQILQATLLISYFIKKNSENEKAFYSRIEDLHRFHLYEENRLCRNIEAAEKAMAFSDRVSGGNCFGIYLGLVKLNAQTQLYDQ